MIHTPLVFVAFFAALLLPNVLAAPYCPQPKICQIMSELGAVDSNSKLGKMINHSGHTLDDFLELFCNFDTPDETITSAVSGPSPTNAPNNDNDNKGNDQNLIADPSPPEVTVTSSTAVEQPAQTSPPSSGHDGEEGDEEDDEEDCDEEEDDETDETDDEEDEEDCEDDTEGEEDDEDPSEDDGELPAEDDDEEGGQDDEDEEDADEDDDCEEEDGEETVTTTSAETSSTPTTTSTEETTTTTQTETTTTSTSAEPSSTAEPPSNDDAKEFLEAHNKIRAKYEVPELAWDEELAASAAAWAAECKREHSQSGQNLAAGSGTFTPTDAVNSWAGEEEAFLAGNYQDGGHFTQMLWKGSTKLGCGKATCGAGTVLDAEYGDAVMVVCNYDPAGNVEDQYEENLPSV